MFDSVDGVDLSKYFITAPIKGILYPGDKPTAVQTTFKAEQELTIKEQPVLKCQVNHYMLMLCVYQCMCISMCIAVCIYVYAHVLYIYNAYNIMV